MENMGNRKFKVNGADVDEIIKRLGLDKVIIDLPDTKETYKALAPFDWDFLEGEEEIRCIEDEGVEEDENENITLSTNPLYPNIMNNFNNMATYIEACFRVAKKSPNMIFLSNLWTEEVSKEYEVVGSQVLAMDHVLLQTLLSSFYNHFLDPDNVKNDSAEIVEDIDKRLKEHWKEAQNHPSLISFVQRLFK